MFPSAPSASFQKITTFPEIDERISKCDRFQQIYTVQCSRTAVVEMIKRIQIVGTLLRALLFLLLHAAVTSA